MEFFVFITEISVNLADESNLPPLFQPATTEKDSSKKRHVTRESIVRDASDIPPLFEVRERLNPKSVAKSGPITYEGKSFLFCSFFLYY